MNLTEGYRDQRMSGFGDLWEVDMATLFSFAFSGLFLAFVVAAIIGHILLIDALVRPFFGGVALKSRSVPTRSGLLPRPAR